MREGAGSDNRLTRPLWLFAAAVTLAGLLAYSNSLEGIFVFDDEPAIAQNPYLRRLWPLTEAMRAPPDTTLSGRPIASLSFALDHAILGGALSGYHATNLAIHLGCSLLLLGIVRRTLLSSRLGGEFAASASTLASGVALLFAVHPLQTGSVTYIVQRVESLMGLFYLTTLYCALRAGDAESPARGRWNVAATLVCALGMATKEVMVTAPLMVVVWDWLFTIDRPRSRRGLYLGLLATWIILAVLVAQGPRTGSAGFGFADWPWWRYLMTQAAVVLHYLRLAFVPSPLVLDYDWKAAAAEDVIWPIVAMGSLLGVTTWGFVRRSPAAFPGIWLLMILAPTSSVLPIVTEVAAEHRMYLPLAGILAFVVMAVFMAMRRVLPAASASLRRVLPAFLVLSLLAVAAVFGLMTYARNADYQNYDRIWSDTIEKRPRNARARNNYATSLLSQGRFAEAEPHLRVAVQEKPDFVEAQANLGVALAAQGNAGEGINHLRLAVERRPDFVEAHRNLGEAYAIQNRLGEAVAEYLKALRLRPDDVMLSNRAAWILATTPDDRVRDGARARVLAERAVRLTSRQDPGSLDALAAAFAESGDFTLAEATVREGLRLAQAQGLHSLVTELQARLGRYSQRLPFREP